MLAIAVAAVAIEQVYHVATGGGKAASSAPATTASPPSATPTPIPRVRLNGQPVPAGAGPLIVLNPGLASPGGQVGVNGGGFDPGSAVSVYLRRPHSGNAVAVALAKAGKDGSLSTQFTMPSSLNGASATVVAQERGSSKMATAQLVTPPGIGRVSIVGKSAGKPGNTATITASGFGPGEKVNVYWGRVGGTPAASLTADGSGSIGRAQVPVGVAPVGPTTMVLVGEKTQTMATVAYQMLGLYPTTVSKPYAVQAGKPMTFSGSGFAPGEQVLIYLNASSGMPALTAHASSGGAFALSFVVPFGLKGSQRLTAIGEQSRASVSAGFDVLPYSPMAQASTYGAMPGTSISFYASGFAANEVVLVYLGGNPGERGQLISAFRVDGHGSASAAGHYIIPSGVGPALDFTLVGAKSGGTAVAKVSVSASKQAVTVPPQPRYVLPPSLGGKPSPGPSAKGKPASPATGRSPSPSASRS